MILDGDCDRGFDEVRNVFISKLRGRARGRRGGRRLLAGQAGGGHGCRRSRSRFGAALLAGHYNLSSP